MINKTNLLATLFLASQLLPTTANANTKDTDTINLNTNIQTETIVETLTDKLSNSFNTITKCQLPAAIELNLGIMRTQMKWWNEANYKVDMKTIELDFRFDNCLSISFMYADSDLVENSVTNNTIYNGWVGAPQKLQKTSLNWNKELIDDKLIIKIGIGYTTYTESIGRSINSKEIDKNGDDGFSWEIGLKYSITENISIGINYTDLYRKKKQINHDALNPIYAKETTSGIGVYFGYSFIF